MDSESTPPASQTPPRLSARAMQHVRFQICPALLLFFLRSFGIVLYMLSDVCINRSSLSSCFGFVYVFLFSSAVDGTKDSHLLGCFLQKKTRGREPSLDASWMCESCSAGRPSCNCGIPDKLVVVSPWLPTVMYASCIRSLRANSFFHINKPILKKMLINPTRLSRSETRRLR